LKLVSETFCQMKKVSDLIWLPIDFEKNEKNLPDSPLV